MKLRALALTNVRRFAGQTARIDDIGDGITVLAAPNESGKSTFFDALHALFFQPYGSRAREVRALQPHSGGAVSVAAEVELPQGRFRLEKTWLSRKSARVTDAATGRVLAQDDEAEAWIGRLVEGGLGGPAGLLWVRQGVTGLDPAGQGAAGRRDWESGLEARRDLMSTLAGEIDMMTGGRRMDQVLAACRDELAELATATGRPRAGGPWKAAEDEVAALEAERAALAAKVDELSGALAERRRAEEERARLDEPAEREAREAALARARQAMKAGEAHAARLEAAERDLKIAALEQEAAEDAAAALAARDRALGEAREAAETAAADERAAQARFESAARKDAATAEALAAAEAALARLRAEHARAQRAALARAAAERLAEMRARLDKAEAQARARAAAQAQIAAAPVDAAAMAGIEAAADTLDRARARRDALAVTVTPAYSGDARVTLDGTALAEGAALALHGRARLDLPGIGALVIDTGGRGAEDKAAAACEAAEAALRGLLQTAGVADLAGARAARAAREEAEAAEKLAGAVLASLAPEGLEALRAEVSELDLAAGGAEQEADAGDPAALAEAMAQAETAHEAARTAREAARRALGADERQLAEARTGHRLAQGRVAEAGAALGPADAHSDRREAAAQRRTRAAETLRKQTAARDGLAAAAPDMANLRAELARAEGAVAAAAARAKTLSDKVLELDGLIRARAEDGVEERLAEVSGRLDAAHDRAARYTREAAALGRLETALTDARRAARDTYFEPVKRELLPLLSLLHEAADIRLDDASLLPAALTRNGQEEPLDILSGGTAEQVAILTRLAFARLFDRAGQTVPVILDDALVHTDDDRIERMFAALHRVAGEQQIIVFTCRNRAFSRLGGSEARVAVEAV
ncbi:DNA repair exonuclease SbcCD ATPase subunit [Rhodovulum iodosum]|uniref:DNA repair exonuclease SbcCD ATPase subunit n=1 Tax=Rhodovulum iodosum TaxID=68291 RepID=A0ABV3XXY8_9RHOB